MLAFFTTLGLTNMTKGPVFGMLFVLLPMAGYFLWNADWSGLRRYLWLWGWLALAAAAAAWYAAACWRVSRPDRSLVQDICGTDQRPI